MLCGSTRSQARRLFRATYGVSTQPGSATKLFGDIEWPNGIGFSPDGDIVYIATTRPSTSLRTTSNRAVKRRTGGCSPSPRRDPSDGLAVDVEGGVWVALASGGGSGATRRTVRSTRSSMSRRLRHQHLLRRRGRARPLHNHHGQQRKRRAARDCSCNTHGCRRPAAPARDDLSALNSGLTMTEERLSRLETRTRYDPQEVEPRVLAGWLEAGHFHPPASGDPKENYSIAVPPPNVTGELHMGHALNGTMQDVLTPDAPNAGPQRALGTRYRPRRYCHPGRRREAARRRGPLAGGTRA